jgi:hypothetical protein
MQAVFRTLVLALAALFASAGVADAQGRHGGRGGGYGHYHGGHGGHGWGHGARVWGGVGLGIGLGAWYLGAPWYYPGYVVGVPAPVYEIASPPPAPPVRAAPDPVVYPRNGQSAGQTEADRQACDRWAMTQPSAMADASVFHRATLACMEGRGYTVR